MSEKDQLYSNQEHRKKTADALLDPSRSGAQFRAIFEGAAIGMALVNQHRRIVRCNPALQNLLGYSEDELCTMTFPEVTHPEDVDADLAQYARLTSGEIDHYQLEKRYLTKNREVVWGRLTVSVVRISPDEPLYSVGMVEDITELKTLEHSLHEARSWELTAREEFSRQLLEATELERHALGAELHDSLGQSLSIISNRAYEALARPGLPAEVAAPLEAIQDSAATAIGELRNCVRDLRPFEIEGSGFTSAISQLVARVAEAAPSRLESRIEEVDDCIKGRVATHLYRIIQEALNNLIRHSRADAARLTLERDIKCIRLSLWDNGRGFEMAAQGESGGVGLASITERARLIGAKMKLQSSAGAGTSLILELPLEWNE